MTSAAHGLFFSPLALRECHVPSHVRTSSLTGDSPCCRLLPSTSPLSQAPGALLLHWRVAACLVQTGKKDSLEPLIVWQYNRNASGAACEFECSGHWSCLMLCIQTTLTVRMIMQAGASNAPKTAKAPQRCPSITRSCPKRGFLSMNTSPAIPVVLARATHFGLPASPPSNRKACTTGPFLKGTAQTLCHGGEIARESRLV